eukprot:Colp12_sorted_trinity150504_noHs@17771
METLAAELLQEVKEVFKSDYGWQTVKNTNNVDIWRQVHSADGAGNESVHSFRGRGLIEAPSNIIFELVKGIEHVFEWEKTIREASIIEKVNENVDVVYMRYKSPVPYLVADRDFVVLESREEKEDGSYTIGCRSVEREDVPTKGIGVVRGRVFKSGWHIQKINDTSSEVTFVAQADLGGWIPYWLMNMLGVDQALNIHMIRKPARKMLKKRKGIAASDDNINTAGRSL